LKGTIDNERLAPKLKDKGGRNRTSQTLRRRSSDRTTISFTTSLSIDIDNSDETRGASYL
jgi:hypothetical protein